MFFFIPTSVALDKIQATKIRYLYLVILIILLFTGLFRNAIAQSGSALLDWAYDPDPVTDTLIIAERVNCTSELPDEIIRCLRNVDADALTLAYLQYAVKHNLIAIKKNLMLIREFFFNTLWDIFLWAYLSLSIVSNGFLIASIVYILKVHNVITVIYKNNDCWKYIKNMGNKVIKF